jgi:3',5'-cyclic AMP phosphodiesterase CpdA
VHVATLDSSPINYRRFGDTKHKELQGSGANVTFAETEQGKWLERDLAAAHPVWKIVVLHHPLYSCHVKRLEDYAFMRAEVEAILARNGVDLVLCGHDHFYYRTTRVLGNKPDPKGIVHVVTGGGGASLYDGDMPKDGTGAKLAKRFHLVDLRIDGERIEVRALAPVKSGEEPEVIDSFELESRK